MPADAVAAATHSRVTSALAASESAVAFLQAKRVFQARQSLQATILHLERARGYLNSSGDTNRVAVADSLLTFYKSTSQKVFRPVTAPDLAANVMAQEGNLAALDPLLSTG